MRLFFADLAELLARVTVGLVALQMLAVVLRVIGRVKRKRQRAVQQPVKAQDESYVLWAAAALVVALSSAVAGWVMH